MKGLTGVGVVAGREIRAKVHDKAFWWSTAIMLVLVTAAVVVPALLSSQVPEHRVAATGTAAEAVVEIAAELGAQAETPDAGTTGLDVLRPGGLPPALLELVRVEDDGDAERLVRDGDVAAALVGETLDDLRLVGHETVPTEVELLVDAAAARLHVARAAAEHGLDAAEVEALATPHVPPVELLEPRSTGSVPPQLLVVVFALLFYVSVLTFGMAIAQSVVEEKQSRVVELLVAAMPVRDLLAGKVLGNTVMALGQVAVVVSAGLVGAAATGRGELVVQLLGAAGWFLAFFLLGFVMLACLWAAAGALASRVEDLNATTVVMQVLVVVPFFAAVFAIEPGSVQRVLSYVPFTAPLLMPARVVLGTAQPWEPFVAAVLVLATGALFVALGARVYRGAVLHTSGRLHAREAWRGTR